MLKETKGIRLVEAEMSVEINQLEKRKATSKRCNYWPSLLLLIDYHPNACHNYLSCWPAWWELGDVSVWNACHVVRTMTVDNFLQGLAGFAFQSGPHAAFRWHDADQCFCQSVVVWTKKRHWRYTALEGAMKIWWKTNSRIEMSCVFGAVPVTMFLLHQLAFLTVSICSDLMGVFLCLSDPKFPPSNDIVTACFPEKLWPSLLSQRMFHSKIYILCQEASWEKPNRI